MQDTLWKYLAYGFFALQTISIIVMLEMLLFGKPYLSLFGLIFALTLHVKLVSNPDLPLAQGWPFRRKN